MAFGNQTLNVLKYKDLGLVEEGTSSSGKTNSHSFRPSGCVLKTPWKNDSFSP